MRLKCFQNLIKIMITPDEELRTYGIMVKSKIDPEEKSGRARARERERERETERERDRERERERERAFPADKTDKRASKRS